MAAFPLPSTPTLEAPLFLTTGKPRRPESSLGDTPPVSPFSRRPGLFFFLPPRRDWRRRAGKPGSCRLSFLSPHLARHLSGGSKDILFSFSRTKRQWRRVEGGGRDGGEGHGRAAAEAILTVLRGEGSQASRAEDIPEGGRRQTPRLALPQRLALGSASTGTGYTLHHPTSSGTPGRRRPPDPEAAFGPGRLAGENGGGGWG